MKKLKIKEVRERRPDEMGFSVGSIGGPNCGREFRMVFATMEDGTKRTLWACNTKVGYFKQVFVPWDSEHKDFIES